MRSAGPVRAGRPPGARGRARRSARALLCALLCASAAAAGIAGTAVPAQAAARVSVANAVGTAQADTRWSTPLTVTGSGFQSVEGGFGGIYVLFGWVEVAGDAWRPSEGGVTGEDLRYVPDSEQAQNQGYQQFVAFPGSQTEESANGGVIAADGSWSVTLTVPGPQFQALDRSGAATTVDCLQVTCGVITIGAHGVVNASNETFTPVSFTEVLGSGAGQADEGVDETVASPQVTQAPSLATVGISPSTPVVGRVISFTGQGFAPGEQVVGSLGAGLAAVGPLTAGTQGEVAGVLQLPSDLRPGTQVIRLSGAASGALAEREFEVLADPVLTAAGLSEATGSSSSLDPALVAVTTAGLLLLAVILSSASTAIRRRRARAPRTPDTQEPR